MDAEFSMNEDITRLDDAGLVVYTRRKNQVLEGGVVEPAPWPIAYIVSNASPHKFCFSRVRPAFLSYAL